MLALHTAVPGCPPARLPLLSLIAAIHSASRCDMQFAICYFWIFLVASALLFAGGFPEDGCRTLPHVSWQSCLVNTWNWVPLATML